jgi:2-oxoglutarate ferredoxin oxidoreductase subunit beta
MIQTTTLTKEDFETSQEPRWCPGCGDYSILTQMKRVLPEIGYPKERIVFVAGIGCSSRFPYYVDTYGIHGIHGRAIPIATGIKMSNPGLSVWVITGDGDALSIGGNHFIHLFRRNVDINVILFNNRIYGLTKGQYSPTSEFGKITKSTPLGSLDRPVNPVELALAAGATFVARTIDREPVHMVEIFKRAAAHKGTSFVEVYQNCNIFNDGAFADLTDKQIKDEHLLYLKNDQPLKFGKDKGIYVDGKELQIVDLNHSNKSASVSIFHDDEPTPYMAGTLAKMTYDNRMPTPIGVFRDTAQPCYEDLLEDQIRSETERKGAGKLKDLFHTGDIWQV